MIVEGNLLVSSFTKVWQYIQVTKGFGCKGPSRIRSAERIKRPNKALDLALRPANEYLRDIEEMLNTLSSGRERTRVSKWNKTPRYTSPSEKESMETFWS